MLNVKQLLAQKLFGIHSVPSKTQVEIQRAYTGLGAEFGQPITEANITFALKREPVAHRIVFAVAHDIFDNWFEVEPLEEGIDEEKFNEAVQKVLLLPNAKDVFTQADTRHTATDGILTATQFQAQHQPHGPSHPQPAESTTYTSKSQTQKATQHDQKPPA